MTTVLVLTGIMTIAMIGIVVWYITKAYAYKHTVDELPNEEKQDEPTKAAQNSEV
ncbi:YtzI protein [Brevibacillus humidisoli]|uniref:YtzI protein n=1 Tax=Brevibacillus humidisoli TaxID=2895522 RepID=UPI001E4C9731|nr:YtzI protein [Brevibacillus humidisoli]UFJ43233.1 YtzI protein [Brevibacillus humidisoli]